MKFQVSESFFFFLVSISHLHLGLEYLNSPRNWGFMIQFEHIFSNGLELNHQLE